MLSNSNNNNKKEFWWVPHEIEVWALAFQSSPELPNGCVNFTLYHNGLMVTHQLDKCMRTTVNIENCPEDLVYLQDVNQASILGCIRERFARKKIYTSIGAVLMAVNPFQIIPNLYGKSVIDSYLSGGGNIIHESAHVYQIPSYAYNEMCRSGNNQSILISGESGSGKTEAAKHCLSFLTASAQKKSTTHNTNITTTTSTKDEAISSIAKIANRIIAASPILEAFGNAKTIRNPNSSRFGKWMVLNFDQNNVIQSANIISYLLEKGRVTSRDSQERNYHIFYQILRGIDIDYLDSWNLKSETIHYKYLEQTIGKEAMNLNDTKQFIETKKSFIDMGFDESEVIGFFRIICSILLLGNVEFIAKVDTEGSMIPNMQVLEQVSRMLGVTPEALSHALTNRSIESRESQRKSMIVISLSTQKAAESRDSLARQLYDKIFCEIISIINKKSTSSDLNNFDGYLASKSIGLLDIFGFEIFVENSFEQLCINYCNEMLQNHFNFVVFTSEKNLYAIEGIVCDTIEFRDNAEIIKEIEFIFKSLDEEGRIPKGSSKTWYDKLKRGEKKVYVSYPNRRSGQAFVVRHYAGDVSYNPIGFLEKNVETLSNDLVACMLSSENITIQRIFATVVNETTTSSPKKKSSSSSLSSHTSATNKAAVVASETEGSASVQAVKPSLKRSASSSSLTAKTISWRFTNQLNVLVNMLRQTESHFIRCIKSNDQCVSQNFDSNLVHKQLIYSGVFEVVKIQQSGLPCRMPHRDFVLRYRCLISSKVRYTLNSSAEMIKWLVKDGYELNSAQMGKTKTFLKSYEQSDLESKTYKKKSSAAKIIQTCTRRVIRQSIYKKIIFCYRLFYKLFAVIDLPPAEAVHDEFLLHIASFTLVVGYNILEHVKKSVLKDLKLLQEQFKLVEDAKSGLLVRTEEGILALDLIVNRAIELDLISHGIIIDCKNTLKKYFQALEFIQLVGIPGSLYKLSIAQIDGGISDLQIFQDVGMEGSEDVIAAATAHKIAVDEEIQNIVLPLKYTLETCFISYDENTGNISAITSDTMKELVVLRDKLEICNGKVFCCADSHIIFAECLFFLQILDEYVSCSDAYGAMTLIESSRIVHSSINKIFIEQIQEFRKWAEIQLSSIKLKKALSKGYIPMTATGKENDAITSDIQGILDKLTILKDPSSALLDVIRAGTWIVKLRHAWNQQHWETLEEIVQQADEDGVEHFAFDNYSECIDELNNAQWQVIHHGLLSDAMNVLNEPIFSSIPMDMENWIDLVKELPENLALVEVIKDFADKEKSPILYGITPMLENSLQLRSLMYQKDIEFSKILHSSFTTSFASEISINRLENSINKELQSCLNLIQKVELEEDLAHAISTEQAEIYDYDGFNEQPSYTTICNLTHSIEDLRSVLEDLDKLSTNYHKDLQEKISLARIILKGRILLSSPENSPEINWDKSLEEFEDSIAVSVGDTTEIPDYMVQEYEIITGEMIRRSLLLGFNEVLCTICVLGEVDINISVHEETLAALFAKYNKLSLFMNISFDEYPNNLKALSSFTAEVLKLRRQVFEGIWDSTLHELLKYIEELHHGGGMQFEVLKDEINKVHAELYAREAILALTQCLENISINFPEDAEDTRNIVDLEPLKKAVNDISSNKGKHSKQLLALAQSVIEIIAEMLAGRCHLISPIKVEEAAAHYVTYHLNSTSVEKVFSFTRVHTFLRSLGEAICNASPADLIFTKINAVRNSLLKIPQRFIPWLKASYIFCELVGAYQSEDWMKIVESTRNLEESIQLLDSIKLTTVGDTLEENRFLDILREKTAHGYSTALKFKDLESKDIDADIRKTMSEKDILKIKLREDDEKNMYGITQLRIAGFEDIAILDIKFPTKYLWALDFDPVLLRKKGFKVEKLLSAGYNISTLYQAGFSVMKLREANCDVVSLREAGVSLDQLRLAGFTDYEVLNGELPENFLKSIEYDASKLLRMGLALKELVAAGFSAIELRAAGFTVIELRNAGFTNINELRQAGFDLQRLKTGFDVFELKASGYSFKELQQSGYDDKSLLEVGFGSELERQALKELFESTNGRGWKVRLNWCTSKPLSQWYGIRVEIDMEQKERVISLDLSDNHLVGTIPSKLCVLSKLRSLHLGMNFLTGAVPVQLIRLIMANKLITDLNTNPSAKSPISFADHTKASLFSPNTQHSIYGNTSTMKSVTMNSTGNIKLDDTMDFNKSSSQLLHFDECLETFSEVEVEEEYTISRVALMDLFHATNGPQWKNKSNWGSDATLDSWYGITTNKYGAIVKIILSSNNLHGSIPETISYLESLIEIDVRLNQIFGAIPETLGHIKSLKKINLQYNRLTNEVPHNLGCLPKLELLDIRGNQLNGMLPKSFCSLKRIRYLGLKSNKFSSGVFEVQKSLTWCKVIV